MGLSRSSSTPHEGFSLDLDSTVFQRNYNHSRPGRNSHQPPEPPEDGMLDEESAEKRAPLSRESCTSGFGSKGQDRASG